MLALRIALSGMTELQAQAAIDDGALRVGGQAMANLTRTHLFGLDGSRANKLGGERSHFYANAAKSILLGPAREKEISFSINQVGLAQRWLGGTIRAGAGTSSASGLATRYLAIPARAEAYGHAPSEFGDLAFRPRGGNAGMLVKKLGGGEEGVGLVYFWLVTEVTQQADPSVMPSEEELGAAAVEAMGSYLARKLS